MGQYQQWLLAQEADRRLRAELEAREAELTAVQRRLHMLRGGVPQCDNSILQALDAQFRAAAAQHEPVILTTTQNGQEARDVPPVEADAPSSERTDPSAKATPDNLPARAKEPFSSTLLNQGGLADYVTTQEMDQQAELSGQHFPTLHREIVLLPEDMLAFFDEHTHTDPRLETPWWLHPEESSPEQDAETASTGYPVNAETLRTNERVRRWIARWHRQITGAGRGGAEGESR